MLTAVIGKLQCVVCTVLTGPVSPGSTKSLLGGAVNRPDPRWAVNEDFATLHTESGLVFGFQRAPDFRPPRWPDRAHPQQFHLDLDVRDLDQAHRQVLELGATLLNVDPPRLEDLRGSGRPPLLLASVPARRRQGTADMTGRQLERGADRG